MHSETTNQRERQDMLSRSISSTIRHFGLDSSQLGCVRLCTDRSGYMQAVFLVIKLTRDGYGSGGLPESMKDAIQQFKYKHGDSNSDQRCSRHGFVPFRYDNGKIYDSAKDQLPRISSQNPLYLALVLQERAVRALAVLMHGRHCNITRHHVPNHTGRVGPKKKFDFDNTILIEYLSAAKGWGMGRLGG